MSTPITDKINALTASANATSGASDATLTDAVGTLISGFGKPELWKTVTIEEDHTNASVANPVYWRPFFGIPEDDILSGTIYMLEVTNGRQYEIDHPSWHIMRSIYFRNNAGSIDNFAQRTNTAIQGMSIGNYHYVSAGAIINIWRFRTT